MLLAVTSWTETGIMCEHCANVHLTPGIICSLQAGLLAQQDSFAPFIWVAVQSVLNVIGDLVLIMYFKQGLAGAAWATVVSQLVGTMGLVWMYRFRGQVMPITRFQLAGIDFAQLVLVMQACT